MPEKSGADVHLRDVTNNGACIRLHEQQVVPIIRSLIRQFLNDPQKSTNLARQQFRRRGFRKLGPNRYP
jgi:hypothetical protein